MREQALELSRSEVGYIADAIDLLVERHGDRVKVHKETGVSRHLMARILKRSASERATHGSLDRVAQAHQTTVEAMLAGKGPRLPKVAR